MKETLFLHHKLVKRQLEGFTLIELIIGMLVASLLTMTAALAFQYVTSMKNKALASHEYEAEVSLLYSCLDKDFNAAKRICYSNNKLYIYGENGYNICNYQITNQRLTRIGSVVEEFQVDLSDFNVEYMSGTDLVVLVIIKIQGGSKIQQLCFSKAYSNAIRTNLTVKVSEDGC